MPFGPVRLPALVCAACVLGCGAGAPSPSVSMVTPTRGYSDRPLRLHILGKGFVPSFEIDQAAGQRRGEISRFSGRVGTGIATIPLHDFDWVDMNTLTALLDPGLPAGQYRVEVTDPRG